MKVDGLKWPFKTNIKAISVYEIEVTFYTRRNVEFHRGLSFECFSTHNFKTLGGTI